MRERLIRSSRRRALGPRNRGGKKVITFFVGRSRLKTAGSVVIASDGGAAPGGCYRTSVPRARFFLFPRALPAKRNIIPRGRLPADPRARPRKLQAKPRASFCGGSRWIRVENVPRKLHPRRRMSRRILDFYLVGKFGYLIDNRNILWRGKF